MGVVRYIQLYPSVNIVSARTTCFLCCICNANVTPVCPAYCRSSISFCIHILDCMFNSRGPQPCKKS